MSYKQIRPIIVSEGGTGNTSLTIHTVLLGNSTSAITQLPNGTTGQVLKASTGIDPVWAQVALTTDVTGVLPIANGGTNASSMTTTDGTIIFDGTRLVTLASTGTNGQALVSAGAGVAPAYGTLPIAGGGTASTSFNINGVVISGTTTTSALTSLTLTSGQVVIGGTTTPAAATLSAGTGVGIVNANNSITISANGGGLTWSIISADQTAAVNHGYFCNKAGSLTLTFPVAPVIGDVIEAVNNSATATGVIIQLPAFTVAQFSTTLTSLAGTITSTASGDTIKMVCRTANSWYVTSAIGNWTLA